LFCDDTLSPSHSFRRNGDDEIVAIFGDRGCEQIGSGVVSMLTLSSMTARLLAALNEH
jgi:hypothetical protein